MLKQVRPRALIYNQSCADCLAALNQNYNITQHFTFSSPLLNLESPICQFQISINAAETGRISVNICLNFCFGRCFVNSK